MDERKTGDIYISEICIKNERIAYDENGDYGADYIELYNDSDSDVELSGYYLVDSNNLSNISRLNGTIIAHDTFMIWCSSAVERTEVLSKDYIPRDYHQDAFSIKAGRRSF